jgi:hypothetical protein
VAEEEDVRKKLLNISVVKDHRVHHLRGRAGWDSKFLCA